MGWEQGVGGGEGGHQHNWDIRFYWSRLLWMREQTSLKIRFSKKDFFHFFVLSELNEFLKFN